MILKLKSKKYHLLHNMFSVGITVPREVATSHVMDKVGSVWGTLYDSARTPTGLADGSDYLEFHFKHVTPVGEDMKCTLQQGNVTLHGWVFSYTMTLEEWKIMLGEKRKRKIVDKFL